MLYENYEEPIITSVETEREGEDDKQMPLKSEEEHMLGSDR